MLLYRVFPYLDAAKDGESGSPTYLHRPQGGGRLDNPGVYDVWYFSTIPEAGIAEVFERNPIWRDGMFDYPTVTGSRRALGAYRVDDGIGTLDLDDARALLDRGLRPTQVVTRNRPTTQAWALNIWNEGRWAGVRWWSFHRPHWPIVALWTAPGADCPAEVVEVETLHIGHRSVVDAAASLGKTLA